MPDAGAVTLYERFHGRGRIILGAASGGERILEELEDDPSHVPAEIHPAELAPAIEAGPGVQNSTEPNASQ